MQLLVAALLQTQEITDTLTFDPLSGPGQLLRLWTLKWSQTGTTGATQLQQVDRNSSVSRNSGCGSRCSCGCLQASLTFDLCHLCLSCVFTFVSVVSLQQRQQRQQQQQLSRSLPPLLPRPLKQRQRHQQPNRQPTLTQRRRTQQRRLRQPPRARLLRQLPLRRQRFWRPAEGGAPVGGRSYDGRVAPNVAETLLLLADETETPSTTKQTVSMTTATPNVPGLTSHVFNNDKNPDMKIIFHFCEIWIQERRRRQTRTKVRNHEGKRSKTR